MSDAHERLTLVDVGTDDATDDLADAVRSGLEATPKSLPCRFFYDEEGSRIFEEICETPEYYPTRAEHSILERYAESIAGRFPSATDLVELGSGSSTKTRVLIEAFLHRHARLRYLPVDISRTMLEESALALLDDYDGLEIRAIAAEYADGLARIEREQPRRRLVLWLGSNVGNFSREAAARFVARVRDAIGEEDRFLIGIDLRKDAKVLEAAYDDAGGVTARFNKNVLVRINRELDGDFDVDAFEHRATYHRDAGTVSMHLVSSVRQRVAVGALDATFDFDAGEAIHTEDSVKYSPDEIDTLARAGGFDVETFWEDDDHCFRVSLFAPR